MKKALITLVMTLAAVFSLAIIASASSFSSVTFSTDFGEVTIIEGMPEKLILDTTSRVTLANGDGTYTTYPSNYILNNNPIFGVDFADLNKNTGKSYGPESIILIEVPEGITSISWGIFGNSNSDFTIKNVEKVILPDSVTTLGASSFRSNESLKSITIGKNVDNLNSYVFCGCKQLVEIIIPKGAKLREIGTSFQNCPNLEYIGFENATELEAITGSSIFAGSKKIQTLDLSKTKITKIAQKAFQDNTPDANGVYNQQGNISLFIFPATYTEMTNIIDKTNNPITVVFLGRMKNVDFNFTNSVITIYFAQNLVSDINGKYVESRVYGKDKSLCYVMEEGAYTSRDKEDGVNIYFDKFNLNATASAGKDDDGKTLCYVNTSACKMYFCSEDKMAFFVRNSTTEGKNLDKGQFSGSGAGYIAVFDVDNANHRVSNSGEQFYLTSHLKDEAYTTLTDTVCTDVKKITYYCVACGKTIETLNTDQKGTLHDFENGEILVILYENGFDKEGYKKSQCLRCTETADGTAPIIFEAKGYSVSELGNAIMGGYKVLDYNALKEYERINKITVTYGVIFVNVNSTNTITFNKNGEITNSNALQAEIIDKTYETFNFTVNNFDPNEESHKNLKLVIAMYVFDGENVSFIQSENAYDDKEVSANGQKMKVITLGALYQKASDTDPDFGADKE